MLRSRASNRHPTHPLAGICSHHHRRGRSQDSSPRAALRIKEMSLRYRCHDRCLLKPMPVGWSLDFRCDESVRQQLGYFGLLCVIGVALEMSHTTARFSSHLPQCHPWFNCPLYYLSCSHRPGCHLNFSALCYAVGFAWASGCAAAADCSHETIVGFASRLHAQYASVAWLSWPPGSQAATTAAACMCFETAPLAEST